MHFDIPERSAYDSDVIDVIERLAECEVAEAAPVMLLLLEDRSLAVRCASVRALGTMVKAATPALPKFIKYFERPRHDDPLADAAIHALAQLGSVAVPAVSKALTHRKIRVRRRGIFVLMRMGHDGQDAAGTLWYALQRETDGDRRSNALYAFSKMGEVDPQFIKTLGRFAPNREHESEQRKRAMDVLRTLGQQTKAARPDVLRAARDDKREVRAGAMTLVQLACPPNESVPLLTAALDDPAYEVREQAARALGWVGPVAKPAVTKFIAMLEDPQYRGELVPLQTPPTDIDPFSYPPPHIRDKRQPASAVIIALGCIGPEAAEAVPAITRYVRFRYGSHTDEAWLAAPALGKIGPGAAGAIPTLIEHLQKTNSHGYAERVVAALGMIGPKAKAAVPVFQELLDGKYRFRDTEYIRATVFDTLGRIGPEDPLAIDILIGGLDYSNYSFDGQNAADALAKFGKLSVRPLIEALDDPKKGYYALKAIEQLGPTAAPAAEKIQTRLNELTNRHGQFVRDVLEAIERGK